MLYTLFIRDIRIVRCLLLTLGLAPVAAAATLGRYRPQHRTATRIGDACKPVHYQAANRCE
jgi:hypothetical protein